jgi:hypothetical protein
VNPLETMRDEINRAIEAKLYYPALALAIALPDICGALASSDGVANSRRYASWYEANLPDYAAALSGADCHSLRSTLLHQGRPVKPTMAWKRVFFPLAGGKLIAVKGSVTDTEVIPDLIGIGLPQFCEAMGRAASEWLEANRDDPNVVQNLPHVMRYLPDANLGFIRTGPILG